MPESRASCWKLMPFGVANAPLLFQELTNMNIYIVRRRSLLQALVFRWAEMDAAVA